MALRFDLSTIPYIREAIWALVKMIETLDQRYNRIRSLSTPFWRRNPGLGRLSPLTTTDILHTISGRIIRVNRITVLHTPYTVLVTDCVVRVDTDGGAVAVLLPAGVIGTLYMIKNDGSSGLNVTITPAGAERIDGQANLVLTDKEAAILVYETTEFWGIMGAV